VYAPKPKSALPLSPMITFDTILNIIEKFYQKATHDFMIGYHFRKIEDFEEHIPRIANFWFLQLNGKVFVKADPPFDLINRHKVLGVKRGEINRWMVLFNETLSESEVESEVKKRWIEKADFFKSKIEDSIF